jgi:hypothetical protein
MIKTAGTRFKQLNLTARAGLLAIAITALCPLFASPIAAWGDPFRYRGGLRNSPDKYRLNDKQLEALLNSLRDKTGFLEMRFDQDGFLALGDRTRFIGGSAAARALLSAAVDAPQAIDLENHSRNPKVAFARLATPISYYHYSSGKRADVYPLEIDFSDLAHLQGDREALAAFDLGFVVLHELGHAALGLRDTSGNPEGLGECEEFINRIRRELNLPERLTYLAQVQVIHASTPSMAATRQAELVFARATEKPGRPRLARFNLRWEALKVGPIVSAPARSVARTRNAKPITATAAGQ